MQLPNSVQSNSKSGLNFGYDIRQSLDFKAFFQLRTLLNLELWTILGTRNSISGPNFGYDIRQSLDFKAFFQL